MTPEKWTHVVLSESGLGRILIEFKKIEIFKKHLPALYLKLDTRIGHFSKFVDESGHEYKFLLKDGDIWKE